VNRIPSSVPGKNIDRPRLNQLKPVEKAIQGLRLSLIQFRKLNGILGALTMQVEDGGDNPEVNAFLVKALRSAVIHHVGVDAGQSAIQTIDAFQMSEEAHWAQTRNGSLPVIQLAPEQRFIDQMQIGYQFLEKQDFLAACQTWIQAWEIAKTMARPEMRTRDEFSKAHPQLNPDFDNWCYDFMFELHNAGLDNRTFHEYRLQYIQEFFTQFPDEDNDVVLNFSSGRAEALWELGKQAESEAVYSDLVKRLPDEAWAYIGWADKYWILDKSPKQYARAEAIMLQALARPQLKNRPDLLERLTGLYKEWGKPEKASALRMAERKLNQTAANHQAVTKEQKQQKKRSRGRRGKKN